VGRLSEEEQQAVYADYQAINQTPESPPASNWLTPRRQPPCAWRTAKTLTTDGPFVELKEAIGGFPSSRPDDLDAAIELASRIRGPASAARSSPPIVER